MVALRGAPVACAPTERLGLGELLTRWGFELMIRGVSATPTEDLAGTATGTAAAAEAVAVEAVAALAVAELPATPEAPDAGALEEPEVLEEPGVLEVPDVPDVPEEPELLEDPEDVLTGVRRDRPDERCLRERPLEVDPAAEVPSAETPAVEGAAAWDSCSARWEPWPCGKRGECEPLPCGGRPPRGGYP